MGSWLNVGKKLDGMNPRSRQEGARFALLTLSAINLLNYADRYVVSAVKELIKEDLHLSDFQTSLPMTGMVVVYMISASFFGILADKNVFDRRYILAIAIWFWSIATALAALSTNLVQLIALRSLVGVGEAAYSTIAPPMLADFFPHVDRNVVYGIFYLALPIGGALGYGVGGVLGAAFSWRVALMAVGLPGVLVSITVLRLNDPMRGINDRMTLNAIAPTTNTKEIQRQSTATMKNKEFEENSSQNEPQHLHGPDAAPLMRVDSAQSDSDPEAGPASATSDCHHHDTHSPLSMWIEFKQIMSNKFFVLSVAGAIANNFCLGGLADWFPTFLVRYDDVDVGTAGLVVGAATIIGGIGGNLLGAKLSEHYKYKVHNSYFLISAVFTLPAAIALLFLLNIMGVTGLVFALLFICEICAWTNLAPISTLMITCVEPNLRARANGINIFLQHLLGDMISPPIIGALSDASGSLRTALQITWIAMAVSGMFWFAGYALLPDFASKEADSEDMVVVADLDYDNKMVDGATYSELLFGIKLRCSSFS